jgi:hypothetical protein
MTSKSDAAKAKFKQDFKSGKMKVNAGEVISPGKIVAKLATKAAAKVAVKTAAKANARGLKAAKKPTNKTGAKADRAQRAELQGNSNLIKNASPARANRTRGGSLYAQQTYGGQGLVSKNLTPKQAARQAEITKEMNPVRKKVKVKDTNTKVSKPKSGVKVKPAEQIPNKPDAAKTMFKNDSSRTRASDAAIKRAEKDEFSPAFRNTDPSYSSKLGERAGLNTKLKRKPNLKAK